MTRLVHVSDLHFGRHDPALADALLRDLDRLRPDVVAISGDLTQRARLEQFVEARRWIDRVPAPVLVVPGNHDLPLTDLVRRFTLPFRHYRDLVNPDLGPIHRDADLVMVGVTTARRSRWREGRIGVAQVHWLREVLCPLPDRLFKVVVSHHPLVPSHTRLGVRPAVYRAALAAAALDACGVDLVLAGHLHVGHVDDVRDHYETVRRSILVVQAGTAISLRRRGEANAYNVLDVHPPDVVLEVRGWDGAAFAPRGARRFTRRPDGWQEAA